MKQLVYSGVDYNYFSFKEAAIKDSCNSVSMSHMHVGGRSTMIVKECWHYKDKRECQKR